MVIIAFWWRAEGKGLCVSLHSNERFLNYPPIVSHACRARCLWTLSSRRMTHCLRQTFWKNVKQITACHLQIFPRKDAEVKAELQSHSYALRGLLLFLSKCLKGRNVDQQEIHCNHIQLGDNFT